MFHIHWQARGGNEWVLLWRSTGRKPMIPWYGLQKETLWKHSQGGKKWLESLIAGAPLDTPVFPQLDSKATDSAPSTVFGSFLCIFTSNQLQVLKNLFCDTYASNQLFVSDCRYPCVVAARPRQPSALGHLGADFDANGCLTCAVPAASVQLIAYLALTTKQARKVVASSKNTDVRKGALIDILGRGKRGEKLNLCFAKETA